MLYQGMKSITIRELRHRWPDAERELERRGEILITRDARPVAKLVRVTVPSQIRSRFDPEEHARWQKRHGGGRSVRWVDRSLAASRTDGATGRKRLIKRNALP